MMTRRIGTLDRPETTLLWTAGLGFVVLSLLLPAVLLLRGPGGLVLPSLSQVGLGLLIGLVSSVAQWLVVLAYRAAPASVLAPFGYLQIFFMTGASWLIFNQPPDVWVYIGAPIVMASGLYIWLRERQLSKTVVTEVTLED